MNELNERLIDQFGHFGLSVYEVKNGRVTLSPSFMIEGDTIVVSPIKSRGGEWTSWGVDSSFGKFSFLGKSKLEALHFADTL